MNQIFTVRDTREDGLIAIQLGKILDNRNVHELAKILKRVHEESYKLVLIDCSKLEFLSSAGVGVILSKNRLISANGGKIVLFDIPDTIMFVLTELDVVDFAYVMANYQIGEFVSNSQRPHGNIGYLVSMDLLSQYMDKPFGTEGKRLFSQALKMVVGEEDGDGIVTQ